MKNKTFLESIKCAARGCTIAIKSEKNYKYYMCIGGIFLILNTVLDSNVIELSIFALMVALVFMSEAFNTAIEYLCNFVQPEYEKAIKNTKDIAAGGVLFAGIGFFLSQIIILGQKLC